MAFVFFSVSKDKMDSVMKGLIGPYPQNFWTRTAPDDDCDNKLSLCIEIEK